MPKRKERTLKELYDVTEKIMEPEITPVLRGSCRIQGPVDETDRDIQKNTVSYRGEKKIGGHFVSERICKRAESGTCNVCSAPCSSCMHLNRAVSRMELKAEDEFSDETSRGKAVSRCSFNVADVQPLFKNRAWGDRQCAVSETSNVVSASSSHESFCENAESKATLRTFHTSEASEDVEMLPKVFSGGTTAEDQSPSKRESVSVPSSCLVGADVVKRTFSNRFEDQRSLECHDDNISCVSGANDANNPVADLSVVVDGRNVSSSSASVSSLLPKGFQEDVNVHSIPGCVVDIKCEVEENGKFRSPSLLTKEFLQNGNPTITSATVGCLTKSGLHEYPSPKDFCADNGPQEVPSPFSHSESGKPPCCNSNAKDLEENLSPHHLDGPSECFTKHLELPLPKLDTPGVGAEKLAMRSCNDIPLKLENNKVSLMSSSSGPSVKIYPCVDSEMDMDSGDSPAESMKCLDHIEKEEKSIASLEVPDAEEPPLHSQHVDDSDGSDIVEDVKVCDICGDAGREDLLAICSRCGDGAEHTYCMRIMVDKVPEGDWLCEECKLKEEAETQRQEKLIVGASKVSCTNEKSNYESILSPKLLPKIPDVDAKRATPKVGSHSQFSTKRQLDSLDGVPAAKRQALDTGYGSPKPSSPGKKAALVRESSFKNMDKGRVKAVNASGGPSTTTTTTQNNPHSPSSSGPNSSRNPPRQLARGTLLKSSSFSFSKPKVKQLQDESLKKPKFARDTASTETKKEGFIRKVEKSLSFHSGSRLNSTVKNKPQSSNSGNEDLRGKKLANERNFIERKNSFKTDRSVVSSPKAGSGGATLKAEQKAPRSESLPVSHPAVNYRDIKAVQPNGRLSKPASLLANRGLDIPKSLVVGGDLRRQSSCLSRGILSPLSAMTSSADHKPTQVSPKDEPTPSSLRPSDRSCSSPDVVVQDCLHQSQECISQSRQIISAGDNSTRCHKCKETGHATQFCPLGTSHISILEASAVRSSKEGPNKINKLKGAVEAVILKKAEANKNIRMHGQSNELAISSTDLNCEVAKDHPSTSSCLRSLTSVEVIRDGQDGFRSSSTDSSRSRTMTNVNTLHPFEAVCTPTAGDSDCLIFSNGNKLKPILTESLSTASTVVGPLSILSIPEYDYIWQGGFEVRRSGRPLELYDGIQAHLSTCASPKVLEAMNKVPCNLLLEEVPRLSTWPSQFHTGATEDNIALYFFAKDFESYERNYKSLVENLIKNDLALKGYLDGVELLIFSSNQLPEKSQRWNMLFFLWGVFRGRKVNCSEQAYASQTKLCGADLNELPAPAMTVSQRDCSSGDAKDLSTIRRSLNEQKTIKATITVDLSYSSSSGKMDKYDGANLHSSDNPLCSVLRTNSSSRNSTTDELHAEMKGNNNSVDEQKDIGSKRVELETRFGVIDQNNSLDNGNKVPVNLDNLNCIEASLPSTSSDWKERSPGSFKVLPVGTSSLIEEVGSVGRRVEENIRERSNGDALILLEKIKEEEAMIGAKAYLDDDLVKKEYDSSGFKSSRKRPCAAFGETFTGSNQSMPWTAKVDYIVVDEESEYKRMKSGYSKMCGSSSSSSGDQSSLSGRFPLQMHSHSSIFPIKEQRLDGSYDDMGIPEDSLTTERRFFPTDLGPVKDWRVGGNTIPLHVVSSDDEDQPESEFPNLELGLGGEKKPPSKQQGMLPLFAALDKKHDQEKEMLPDINVEVENGEEDVLASLSLSLAFPFSEEQRSVKSVSQPEAPLPERQPVDTSLILFGGFSDT